MVGKENPNHFIAPRVLRMKWSYKDTTRNNAARNKRCKNCNKIDGS